MIEDNQRAIAWQYYVHADNLNHQRHGIFMLAQSIFFAAFASSSFSTGVVLAVVGVCSALLWNVSSTRLQSGLEYFLKKKSDNDELMQGYFDALNENNRVHAKYVFHWIFPWMFVAAWIALIWITYPPSN